MSVWLDVAVRSTAIAVLGLAVLAALGRHSAAVRHLVVAGTLAAMAVVAPLGWALPEWRLPAWRPPLTAQAPAPVAARSSLRVEAAPVPAVPPARQWLTLLWAIGAGVTGIGLLRGLAELRVTSARAVPLTGPQWDQRLADAASRLGVRRRIELLVADTPLSPATWGIVRPRVLLPAAAHDWPDDRARAVLLHEVAHISRHDWTTQLCAEVLRVLLWFQPLVWVLSRRLRRESELASDDAALGGGLAPDDYAVHLLALARACRHGQLVAVPMARQSTLEQRITAMLAPTLDRSGPSLVLRASLAALWLAVTIPVAAFQSAQPAPMPLAGTVYDPTGAVMPDVAVRLTAEDGTDVEATTDAEGRFHFPTIAPGRYELHAAVPGFRQLQIPIELRRAQDWTQEITLELGTVREEITVSASRLPSSRAEPSAGSPRVIRVGGNLRPPRKTKHVSPVYPERMRAEGVEGSVPIEAIISSSGSVQSVRILSGRVHPELAIAAVDAVRQWQFEPTLLNGAPVDVALTTTVTFTLDQ